jgi:hypothetical protein
VALADPPTPKVCVVVAGDPDDVARTAARELERGLSTRADVRLVSDEAARAVLRGEPAPDASVNDVAADRRQLHGDDRDALGLFTIGQRFGCALDVEIASRPEGLWVRRYDVIHHTFIEDGRIAAIDASSAPAVAVLARRIAAGSIHLAWGISPLAHVVVTAPPPRVLPSSSSPPPATAAHAANGNSGPGIIGWVIAGGAAALLIGGFLVAQSVGPGSPVITVTHPAGNSP